MDYKEIKRENGEATIEYRIAFEEFTPYINEAYKKERGKFSIPGFRKGKAPRALIERHYGEDIFYDDALNTMIPDLYDKSIEELELTPVAQPHFSMEELDKDTGIVLHALVTLLPEVQLGQYKNLTVEAIDTTISEDDVASKIEEEAEKNARMIPVDVAQEGDTLTMDFVGTVEGEAFEGGSAEDFSLELGSAMFIPGFEEQLIGKSVGAQDVHVVFPEDYAEESLAGKAAHFAVTVHDIKRKEVPEINDELASDISEFDTLEEYKADLRRKLEEEKKKYAEDKIAEEALLKAIENMQVDIPRVMVDEGVERKVHEVDSQLRQQGFSLEQFLQMTGETMDNFKTHYYPQVELDIKRELLLEEIIKAEAIEISDEEIDEIVRQQCEEFKVEEEEVRRIYGQDDYAYLKQSLRMEKAQKLIMDTAEVIQ